eukprot:156652-Chlamydomonas_euryale.AAC.2
MSQKRFRPPVWDRHPDASPTPPPGPPTHTKPGQGILRRVTPPTRSGQGKRGGGLLRVPQPKL